MLFDVTVRGRLFSRIDAENVNEAIQIALEMHYAETDILAYVEDAKSKARIITKSMLRKGYNDGLVRLIVVPSSPDGKGTVAQIGARDKENYFFFGGVTAEDMTPDEYKKNVPQEDILNEIMSVLDDFHETDSFQEEYDLYYSVLNAGQEAVV